MLNAVQKAYSALRASPTDRRSGLFRTYARIKAKAWLARTLGFPNPKTEQVLGFRVEFSDYSTLVYLFEEIFVNGDYHFRGNGGPLTIIDCGSNIGMSVLFFKRLYPQSRVIAFEPNARAFELLQHNVRQNNLQGVELHQRAVEAAAGQVDLYFDPQHPCALRTATRAGRLPGAVSERVEAVALSAYVTSAIDLLKLDIEGAEVAVIEELAEHDRLKMIDQVIVEYHHHIEPGDDRLGRLLHLFEQQGFGYQLRAHGDSRSRPGGFQDILIYAYARERQNR